MKPFKYHIASFYWKKIKHFSFNGKYVFYEEKLTDNPSSKMLICYLSKYLTFQ